MKALLLMVVGIVVVFATGLALRLGAFKDVQVFQGEEGPTRQVYAPHTGPYHKIVSVITRVESWAKENGETCEFSFGEYLDDPKRVDEDRLQSLGGCIVEKDWSSAPLPEGLAYREIPRAHYVIARFDGAPSISPYKVYPKVFDYMAERGITPSGPITEVYRVAVDNSVDNSAGTGAEAKYLETKYLFPAATPASR